MFTAPLQQTTGLALKFGKTVGAGRQSLVTQRVTGIFGVRHALDAGIAFRRYPSLLLLETINRVSAALAPLMLQILQAKVVVLQNLLLPGQLGGGCMRLHVQFGKSCIQQRQPALLTEQINALSLFEQLAAGAAQGLQRLEAVAGGRERIHLLTRHHYGAMRGVEFAEVFDQPIGGSERLRLVQHEAAQKLVEIAQILGRLGLVQQLQRHFAADAEQTAEAFGIACKRVEVMDVVAETRLQATQVQVEALQLGGDVEGSLGHHVVLAHVRRG